MHAASFLLQTTFHLETMIARLFVCSFLCIAPLMVSSAYGQAVTTASAEPTAIKPLADAPEMLKMVIDAFHKQQATYAQVRTLEYTAQSSRIDNNHPPDIQPSKLHFLSKGESYFYEYNPVEYPGKEYAHYTSSYDGNDTRKLNTISRHMTLKKGVGDDGGTLFLGNYLFLPQKFFAARYDPTLGLLMKPAYLADSSKWSEFLKKFQVLGRATILGRDCIVAQLDLDKEPFTEQAAKVEIYLDANAAFFPVGWDLLTLAGERILTYRIDELAFCPIDKTLLALPYPKKATRVSYITSEAKVTKLPEGTSSIAIDSITINRDIGDDLFTIDPATAADIHDLDSDMFITVPR